jgi:hypothetical protein
VITGAVFVLNIYIEMQDLIRIYVFSSELAPMDINKTGSLTIYVAHDHPFK